MNRLMLSIRVWLVRSVNEHLTEGLPTIGRACRHTATRAATCTRTNALHRLYPQCQRQELDCVGGAIPRLQRRQLLRRQRQGDGELRPVPNAALTCDDRPCTSTEPSCVFWARNTAPSTGTEPQLSTRQRTCGVAAETHSTTHARGRRDLLQRPDAGPQVRARVPGRHGIPQLSVPGRARPGRGRGSETEARARVGAVEGVVARFFHG